MRQGDASHSTCIIMPALLMLLNVCAVRMLSVARGAQGIAWISHMKRRAARSPLSDVKLSLPVKLPANLALPASVLRDVPVLPDLPMLYAAGSQPGTFQDVWADVDAMTGVANVHFPFYNAVTRHDQAVRLRECLRQVCDVPAVKVIVLHGAGKHGFNNGMDYNLVHAATNPFGSAWATMNAMNDVVREVVMRSDKVVVAAVDAGASAGGAMLAAACDAVWAHGGTILNPHYKAMGVHGSDYWTFTLPRRVGVSVARELTNGMQPVSAHTAADIGLVDDVLTPTSAYFSDAVAHRAAALARDSSALAAALARKAAGTSNDALEEMHRARMYEGIVMRDNLREAGHVTLRKQLVEKIVPLATPQYLAGQASAFGRVLDGKALAALKVKNMKEAVNSMKQVRRGRGCRSSTTCAALTQLDCSPVVACTWPTRPDSCAAQAFKRHLAGGIPVDDCDDDCDDDDADNDADNVCACWLCRQ